MMKVFSQLLDITLSMFCISFPPPKQTSYNLRTRGHGLIFPEIQLRCLDKNFLFRMLYSDIY